MPTLNVEVDLQVATVGLGPVAARDPTDVELRKLRQVRTQLRREASHFYAPDQHTGDWIKVDLEMGWSTSHGDSDLPDLDDVVLFFGSMASERSRVGTAVDLMLCGSTEHLLKKTATAGRMGSGTEWLHELILKIHNSDARGDTEIPDDLTRQALAVPRWDCPDVVARWVFDVIAEHHAPRHRARVQGLARVDLNIPEEEWLPRLVVATPLYVQDASSKPMRWAAWRVRRFRREPCDHGGARGRRGDRLASTPHDAFDSVSTAGRRRRLNNLIFLGEGAENTGTPADINEAARIEWITLGSVRDRIARGEIIGAGTQIGLLQVLAFRGIQPH
ncbi:MAG: SAVMC3_10250 family protein [Pseudonocardiaceae bacterium]